MKKFVLGVLALGLAFPVAAMAQDGDDDDDRDATILMISSYQCPNSAIAGITEGYETHARPIDEELIGEGKMESTGLFFHTWADEWNVNLYRTGYDIGQMIAAIAEAGPRVVAANPELADQPGPYAECTAHKDNIYTFGPTTGDDDDDGDGGN